MMADTLGPNAAGLTCFARRVAGQLIVLRVGALRSMADWHTFSRSFFAAADEAPGPLVLCADYRRLQVLSDDVAKALVSDFRHANPRVHRSAILLPHNAHTVRLQMERMLRDARNAGRRISADPADAKAWLSSELAAPERAALDQFLGSLDPV